MSENKILDKIFILLIGINLFSVILAFTILNNSNLLIYFYIMTFAIQIFAMFILFQKKNIKFSKSSLTTLGLYMLVLILPIITNLAIGIDTNIYDLFSIIFKVINFLFLYSIMGYFYITQKQFKNILKFVILIGTIACFYNYVFCYGDIMKIFNATSSYQIDIKSFFHNRNMFGEFMFISLLSTFYYYNGRKSKIKNLLILLFSITAFITFSRSAIFSVGVLLIYMLLYKYGKSKKTILIVLSMIILTFILLQSHLNPFLQKFVIRGDNFSTGRDIIWEQGFNIFEKNPINGIGYYTALDMAQSYGMTHTQFHSFFIDTLVGYGILGIIFYIVFFMKIFTKSTKALKNNNKIYYRQCIIASYIIIFVKMFIESISIFSVGYSDLITTIYYISIPLLLSNSKDDDTT